MAEFEFVEVLVDGTAWYLFADGTLIRPISGGADDDGGDDKGGDDGDAGDDDDGDKGGDDKGDKGSKDDKDLDWKARSRANERRAKKAQAEAEALKKKLEEHESKSKSEHEKAIEAAKKEAEDRVRSEAAVSIRADRLEASVARLAAGKFADVDDALLRIEGAIRRGELDPEDVYDTDNRVQSDVVKDWLEQLLKDKPHLAASSGDDEDRNGSRGRGSADGGARGGKGGGKSVDDMGIEDHLAKIKRHK